MAETLIQCFDGHNDILSKIRDEKNLDPSAFINGFGSAELDLPKAEKGGLIGGLCAVYPPSVDLQPDENGVYPELLLKDATKPTMEMAKLLHDIEKLKPERFKICKTARDIKEAIKAHQFAAVFHIEGAEAIGENLEELARLYQDGLRSLGPVWSRPNIFGFGVPFKYGSTGDIGPGLTDTGKKLVRECNKLGIMVDLSHMNEKGFWDIAKLSDAPLVASHSNAYHLSHQSRNLTDEQLRAIGKSKGLVGINFGVKFLREDGERNRDTPLKTIINHMRYIVDIVGVEHVGLGSDFDGTTIPNELHDCSQLPKLVAEMEKSGFNHDEIEKITSKNWISVLERTWGE